MSHLKSTSLSLEHEPQPGACAQQSVDEIVSSITQLYSMSERPPKGALEALSTRLFQKTAASDDPDTVLMTLFAAASCYHPSSLSLGKKLITSENPLIQLASVQVMTSLQSSATDLVLTEALHSDFPVIRLEAAWQLAKKRGEKSFFHIDALSYKLPKPFRAYVPELFAIEGSVNSQNRLRQLLFDADGTVVLETLIAIGSHGALGTSDLLLSLDLHVPDLQEALAYALRSCDTALARSKLKKMALSTYPSVSIRAALSLIELGEVAYQKQVQQLADQGNLFATAALGKCPDPRFGSETEPLNTALSLLTKRDARCIPLLKHLFTLPEDLILVQNRSIGHSLSYWSISPIDGFARDLQPALHEQSLLAKEFFLKQALEIEEDAFAELATTLFDHECVELYPCLLHLINSQQSEAAIALLKKEATAVGKPYNRATATIGLIYLDEEKEVSRLLPVLDLTRDKQLQLCRIPIPWMAQPGLEELTAQQRTAASSELYADCLQILAEKSSSESSRMIVLELSRTPKRMLPCAVAALLHTTL